MSNKQILKLVLYIILAISSKNVIAEQVLINIEDPVVYFINHTETFKDMDRILKDQHYVGITGPSGIGKSEIVRKYVSINKDKFQLIAFIDTHVDLLTQYIEIANEINAKSCKDQKCNINTASNEVVKSLQSYLNTRNDWLLVFDNLHVNENSKVKNFLDWKHEGNIIICSQDKQFLVHKIDVKSLDDDSSYKLTEGLLRRGPSINAKKLIQELKEYPTSILVYSVNYLAINNHINMDDFIDYMNKQDDKTKALVELIYKELDTDSKEVITKIALFKNDKIARDVLENIVTNKDRINSSISTLIRYGIIDRSDVSDENPTYRIHDQIRDAIMEIQKQKPIK